MPPATKKKNVGFAAKTVTAPEKSKVFLTLSEALRDKESSQLYVLNTSNKVNPDNKYTELLIDVTLSTGTSTLLVIPNTWIPVEVTATVPRENVLDSISFRRALSTKLICMITVEEAERIFAENEDDIIAEQRRLNNRGKEDDGGEDETVQAVSQESKASPEVIEIMNRNMNPRDRLAAVRVIGEGLTKDDIKYIITKAQKTETKLLAFLDTVR